MCSYRRVLRDAGRCYDPFLGFGLCLTTHIYGQALRMSAYQEAELPSSMTMNDSTCASSRVS